MCVNNVCVCVLIMCVFVCVRKIESCNKRANTLTHLMHTQSAKFTLFNTNLQYNTHTSTNKQTNKQTYLYVRSCGIREEDISKLDCRMEAFTSQSIF